MTVPAHLPAGGTTLRVDRVWPDDRHGLVVEGRDDRGRLRAGRLPRDGGPVQLVPYGTDERLPALPGVLTRPGARLLVHRLGKRAVVALPDGYAKVVRPSRAAALAARSSAGAALAERAGFAVPRVRRVDPDGVIETTVVPGTALHAAGLPATADAAWHAAWRGWSQRWERLLLRGHTPVAGERSTGEGVGPVHDAAAEAGVLEHWVRQALSDGVVPERHGSTRALLARTTRLLTGGPPQPVVPAHRDLHDKQLLATADGAIGLLDFDTLTLAEPALDLANLRVHVLLRLDQGRWSPARTAVALAGVDRVLDRCRVAPERSSAYAAATALRLVCVHAYRPADRPLALRWLDRLVGADPEAESSLAVLPSGRRAEAGGRVT